MLFSLRMCVGLFEGHFSLTYSFSIIPEERSSSSSTVTQGNNQSQRILPTSIKGGTDG